MTQRLDDMEAILTIAEVAQWDYDYLEGFRYDDLPQGWKFLGNGVARWAFLAPDGWVYKFGSRYQNSNELLNAQRLYLEQDDTLRVPWVEYVGEFGDFTILRCEFIAGEWQSMQEYYGGPDGFRVIPEWKAIAEYLKKYGLGDLHYENVCFVDGVPAVVDLGW